MDKLPLYSVIILTLNEEKFIGPLLTSLASQTDTNFEVIVVDAQSTDNTLDVIGAYRSQLDLTILSTPARNLSTSRNLGAERARGRYLFFIDADNTVPHTFLEKAHNYIRDDRSIGIPKLIPNNKKKLDSFVYFGMNNLIRLFLLTPRPFSTGSSMIVPQAIFQKIQGFDSSVIIAEDQDIVRRLKKKGGKLIFMNDAPVLFSTRRFDENAIQTYAQYLYSSLYLLIFSKITRKIYKYEMGGNNFTK